MDDCLIIGDSALCSMLKRQLAADYRVRDYGTPDTFLGMEFRRTDSGDITISQSQYILSMAKRFDLIDQPTVSTPLPHNVLLSARNKDEEAADGSLYRSIIGSLLYASTSTRPDVSFAVKELARFMMDPSAMHMMIAKRVVSYLLHTHSAGITYSHSAASAELHGYSDADWASAFDRKSTSGYVFMASGGAVSWGARQQKTVAHSSAESEYVALSLAGRECLWLTRLHSELVGVSASVPTVIYEDNQACALWTQNPIHHSRQKHIDICHHAIRDWVADKRIIVRYVRSADQLADLFTKGLPAEQHAKLMHFIMGNATEILQKLQGSSEELPANLLRTGQSV